MFGGRTWGFCQRPAFTTKPFDECTSGVVKKGEEIISSIDLFKICAAVICIFFGGSGSFVEKVTLLQNKEAN